MSAKTHTPQGGFLHTVQWYENQPPQHPHQPEDDKPMSWQPFLIVAILLLVYAQANRTPDKPTAGAPTHVTHPAAH